MKKIKLTLLAFVLLTSNLFSQAPSCPTNSIFAHNGNMINGHSLPNGPSSVVLNNLPPGASGLAVGPAFAFPAPNPTWWVTSGGTYWYYNNGGTWSNTGHSTGNGAAVNIGGGGTRLYNLVGFTGQVYVYNGTGNGTLLNTLVPAFNGGGPYDLVADMADNFFVLKSAAPAQGLYIYNPQGVLTCSLAALGMISQTAGGGFAILETANPSVHRVYYNSNGTDYIGDAIPSNTAITFTPQALPGGSDYASCALPVPSASINAPQGGTLTCTVPSIPLVAQIYGNGSFGWGSGYTSNSSSSSTSTCGGITWSGPNSSTSFTGTGQGTYSVTVWLPGVYSYTINGCGGCPGYSLSASYTVVGQGATFNPIITAPTCISSATQISVSPNSTTNTIIWNGPGIQGPNNTPTITINAPGIYSVSVGIPNSNCLGTTTVLISQTPTVTISASSNSMCLYNSNGSLNSVTLTALGATNYSWTNISGLINTSPSTTASTITFTPDVNATIGSVTLLGSNGVCSNATEFTMAIIPNPTVAATSGSICVGGNIVLTASNATNYTWSPSASLNSNNSATVLASPTITTVYNIIGESLGCFSETQTSTVSVSPLPIITIAPLTNTICQGGNLTLTANGATNYTWSPAASLNTSNGPVVIASPLNTTNYTVIGELNTCTASAVYQVSVIIMPNLLITTSAYTICQNSNAVLTANGASSYTWSPSVGLNTSIGSQVIATPANTTTYIVTGGNGECLATGSIVITVVPFPNFFLSTPNPKICETNSTSIFASGADEFQWTPPTGLSNINSGMAIASPLSSTNYTVRGINTLGDVSCSSAKEIYIEVVPQVNASVSNSIAICSGQSVKLMSAGSNYYEWTPKEGLSDPYVSSPLANPKTTTVYSVNVSNAGFCGQTATVLVKVNPKPQVSAGEDIISNIDEPIHLNATGSGTLTWISGEKIVCANCPNTQIMPSKSGCYKVEVVNEFGCKAEDEICVEITTNYNIYIPNIFTPNGDGNNDVFMVYGTGLSKFEMIIFDRWGEKLFTSKDQQLGWDGYFKGELSKNDAYTYQVKYQSLDGKTHTRTGHVTLMK